MIGCILQVGVAQALHVLYFAPYLFQPFRDDNRLAGHAFFGVTAPDFNTVFSGKAELAVVVFTCASIFSFLDNHHLVLVHLPGKGDRGCQAGIPGWAALNAFYFGEQLGHIKNLALGNQLVFIHITQRTGSIAGNIHPVRPGSEGHAKPGMPGGEGFAVKIAV